ncbi:MAG: hypothetical protein LH630_04805, partial [Actinomycetia bacterium]|nr:hypothetical protein [Actinomycetes bacterium]
MAGQRRLDEQAVASMRGVVITEGVAADHDQLRSVLRRAREAVEASGAVLVVSNATDGLDVVATIGCDPADIEHFRHIAADADVPLAECVRLNDRVSCESAAERAERYP